MIHSLNFYSTGTVHVPCGDDYHCLEQRVYTIGNTWQVNVKTCFSMVFPKEVKEPAGVIKVVCWVRNSLKCCGQGESEKFQPLRQRGFLLFQVSRPHTQGVSKWLSRWGGEEEEEARTGLSRLFPLLHLPWVRVCASHHFPRYQSQVFSHPQCLFPSLLLIAKPYFFFVLNLDPSFYAHRHYLTPCLH